MTCSLPYKASKVCPVSVAQSLPVVTLSTSSSSCQQVQALRVAASAQERAGVALTPPLWPAWSGAATRGACVVLVPAAPRIGFTVKRAGASIRWRGAASAVSGQGGGLSLGQILRRLRKP